VSRVVVERYWMDREGSAGERLKQRNESTRVEQRRNGNSGKSNNSNRNKEGRKDGKMYEVD
jgi:hypothetical protein